MRSRRRLLGVFTCALACVTCLPEGSLKGAYSTLPLELNDDWSNAMAEASQIGVSREAVAAAYAPLFAEDAFPEVVSMLVVRSGYLIAEGYFKTLSDAQRPEHIMELTQVVTGLMVGVARGRGLVPDPQQDLATLLPEAAQTAHAAVTLADLLTMRSGIVCPDDWLEQLVNGDVRDSTSFMLRQLRQSDSGAQWQLQGCGPHLVGRVLQRALGEPFESATRRLLLQEMGVTGSAWTLAVDGAAMGGVGLMLTPRDLARVGALVWRRGLTPSGAALMPAAWIDDSTRAQVTDVAVPGVGYGYFWYTDEVRDAVFAEGQGGQFLYIDNRYDLVVVLTSAPHANGATTLGRGDFLHIIDTLTGGM